MSKELNAPGVPIPGWEGRYTITEDGTVWSIGVDGCGPGKPGRASCALKTYGKGGVTLRSGDRRRSTTIAALYREAFGRELPEPPVTDDWLPTYEDWLLGYDDPPPIRDECGYEPLPGMTDAEAWPADEHRRVLWGTTWGIAVGARGWRWWVVLDGEDVAHLFSPSALVVSPGPEWEAEWRRLRAAEEARIAADVASEALFLRKTRAALGRGEYAGRKVVAG